MKLAKDLTGKIFGRLSVIKLSHINDKRERYWVVQCNCKDSIEFTVRGSSLTNGNTKSCGCIAKEETSKRFKRSNTYNLSGEYGVGYTTKGEEFYFDLEDYDLIKDYCWYIDKAGYIRTNKVKPSLKLHTFILNNIFVDHINGITIDNRKSNLRIVDDFQNTQNAKIRKDNTSGAKGVKWNKKYSMWVAQINYQNIRYHLGYFNNIKDGIKTREIAELYLFNMYSRRYHELKDKYKNIDVIDYIVNNIPKILK